MSILAEAHNVCCGYGSVQILKQVSFAVKRGSICGIIGPNGSGKTTLFRALSGELGCESGQIKLDGKPLKSISNRERARFMAVLEQHPSTADIRVEDYVLMGRMPHRRPLQLFESEQDYQIAHRYMKRTGVYPLRNRLLSKISGGEQQMVHLTRALVREPELLLLDEPTTHLDINHQMQLLNLVESLNTSLSLTIVVVLHDLTLAAEFCDYLVMLKEGKIFCQGGPEEVIHHRVIEEGYGSLVVTQTNPVSGKPAVFPVSDRVLRQHKKTKSANKKK